MNPAIKSILAGSGTGLSSKRVVMFALLIVFIGTLIIDLTCKRLLDPTLRDQLYYSLLTVMSMVFGEGAITTIRSTMKKTGVDEIGLPDENKPTV